MPVQTEVVGRTWGTLAFPRSLSHQNCIFFWLPNPMEQMQLAGSLDLSYRFPEQEGNHAIMQQLECMCLLMPTDPLIALKIEEALPQPMLLHLMSMATQHLSSFQTTDIASVSPITEHIKHGATLPPPLLRSSSQPGQVLPSVLGQWGRRHFKSRLGFGGFVSSLKKRLFKIIQHVTIQRLTRWTSSRKNIASKCNHSAFSRGVSSSQTWVAT